MAGGKQSYAPTSYLTNLQLLGVSKGKLLSFLQEIYGWG